MILNFTYILYFKLFSLCHRLEKKNANFNRRWQDGKRKKEEARKKFWCGQSHLNRREFICTIDLTSKWLSMVSLLLYIIFNNFIKWDINWLITQTKSGGDQVLFFGRYLESDFSKLDMLTLIKSSGLSLRSSRQKSVPGKPSEISRSKNRILTNPTQTE